MSLIYGSTPTLTYRWEERDLRLHAKSVGRLHAALSYPAAEWACSAIAAHSDPPEAPHKMRASRLMKLTMRRVSKILDAVRSSIDAAHESPGPLKQRQAQQCYYYTVLVDLASVVAATAFGYFCLIDC